MTNKEVQEAVRIGQLIRTVDDKRGARDPFKLPAWLKTLHHERLEMCLQLEQSQQIATGDRTTSADLRREALLRLEARLRDGFNYLKAIPEYELDSPEIRRGLLESYGWDGGLIGSLQAEGRLLALGRKAVATARVIEPERARYPEALSERISHELAIIASLDPKARAGTRSVVTKARNTALKQLALANSRVRHYLCACTDEIEKSQELASIGFQPRRVSGQRVTPPEKPLPPVKPNN